MIEYKIILGYLAIALAFASYIIYFRQIFGGKTKPHAFSWLVWTLLTGTAFAAQVVKHGGAGAWVTGVTSFACFLVFIVALLKGKKQIVALDWIFLSLALGAMLLWWLTKDPTLSVILVATTDALGILPTVRKGFDKPKEESATLFALSGVKFLVAFFALQSYSLATWLYPASLVLTNGIIVAVLLIRRWQISAATST